MAKIIDEFADCIDRLEQAGDVAQPQKTPVRQEEAADAPADEAGPRGALGAV